MAKTLKALRDACVEGCTEEQKIEASTFVSRFTPKTDTGETDYVELGRKIADTVWLIVKPQSPGAVLATLLDKGVEACHEGPAFMKIIPAFIEKSLEKPACQELILGLLSNIHR